MVSMYCSGVQPQPLVPRMRNCFFGAPLPNGCGNAVFLLGSLSGKNCPAVGEPAETAANTTPISALIMRASVPGVWTAVRPEAGSPRLQNDDCHVGGATRFEPATSSIPWKNLRAQTQLIESLDVSWCLRLAQGTERPLRDRPLSASS